LCRRTRGAALRKSWTGRVKKGQIVPGNIHFDTTKAHIEDNGGQAVDYTIDQIYDPYNTYPFKGTIDLRKLEAAITRIIHKIMAVRLAGHT